MKDLLNKRKSVLIPRCLIPCLPFNSGIIFQDVLDEVRDVGITLNGE